MTACGAELRVNVQHRRTRLQIRQYNSCNNSIPTSLWPRQERSRQRVKMNGR